MNTPDDPKRSKLIAAKRQWAADGRLLTGTTAESTQRLPPGQRLVTDWPVLDLGNQPEVTPARFRLDIDGAVRRPLSLNWQEYQSLPTTEQTSDMHCVTQWSRYDNRWTGIPAAALLADVQPLPSAAHVILHSYDGYSTNVRLDQFAEPDVMLVHAWNGEPLTTAHGGPVRAMIPRLYLWKSAKWLRRIEITTADKPGFWERNGYHNNADPWQEERYDD